MGREYYQKHESVYCRGAGADVLLQELGASITGWVVTKENASGTFDATTSNETLNKTCLRLKTGATSPALGDHTSIEKTYAVNSKGKIQFDVVFNATTANNKQKVTFANYITRGGIRTQSAIKIDVGGNTVLELNAAGAWSAVTFGTSSLASLVPQHFRMTIDLGTRKLTGAYLNGEKLEITDHDAWDDTTEPGGQCNTIMCEILTNANEEGTLYVGDMVIINL